jgi:hypothetical protein
MRTASLGVNRCICCRDLPQVRPQSKCVSGGQCTRRPDRLASVCVNSHSEALMEIRMYIGGILGTIILIALIVWVVRRV